MDKKIFLKSKLTLQNQPAFLLRLSVLLKEGFTFNDGLNLLLPHHIKDYQTILKEIDEDFRDGQDVTRILQRFGFSARTLLPVAIAEKNGKLMDALEAMAKTLERTEETKKKLKNLLTYPAVLFVFISILLFGFRSFFLPNMEVLATSRQGDEVGISSSLPSIVAKLPDFIIGTGIVFGIVVLMGSFYYGKLTAYNKIRFAGSIPIVGQLFFSWKTHLFASEVGGLLESGLSMQEALEVLIKQKLDPVLSEIARNVHEQVIYGDPFHVAIEMTSGLLKEFSSFAQHGADSGYLPKELILYSEHLEDSINRRVARGLSILQPALFSIIAICILAAYIALLLPIYGMLDKM